MTKDVLSNIYDISPDFSEDEVFIDLLKGQAKLKLEAKEYILKEGEYLLIAKDTKHWVTYTANPTIWLAIHFRGK